jgi:hypothetical protein
VGKKAYNIDSGKYCGVAKRVMTANRVREGGYKHRIAAGVTREQTAETVGKTYGIE